MSKLNTNKTNTDTNIKDSEKRLAIKFDKKLLVILTLIIVLGIGFVVINTILANQGLKSDAYTILKKGSNISKINVKGEVKSETSTNVYSNTNLTIKEVKVKVGDEVKANDVLAVLDTSKLEDQIKELEATISTTDASNKVELSNAKSLYETALAKSSDENNADIKNAEVSLNAAKLNYEHKKEMYDNYKILNESDAISDQELKEYKISYENAKDTFDNCTVALDNIKAKVQQDLITAKNSYEAAKIKTEDNSQHISLENLKKDLQNAVIISPVDGIISIKNANVGNPSTGVLFEILDKNNTTVTVTVKEVDIEKITVGQRAEIKTDSTGTDVIAGQVISVQAIAKVEDEGALDLNNDSNDKEAKFEVKINITNPDHKLKIGMKAQADIIIDEKNDVYTIPVESVLKDKDDNDCIYVADKKGSDYVIKQISITKGTESDLNVEISGQDLKDGLIVLNNPSDYEVGSTIKIKGI